MNSLKFTTDLLGKVFGEEHLSGLDLQYYVNTYMVASGNPTDPSEFEYSNTFAIYKDPDKRKNIAGGFTIYEPNKIEELHYLSYWEEPQRKCLLFDAHISDVQDIVEVGKFYVNKDSANNVQRFKNYFSAILLAYATGRKHLIVGTYYVGSSYHQQLLRVCPNVLYEGKVTTQNGEIKDIVLLHNTRRQVINLLIMAALHDILKLIIN